ncbi:putative serine-threonine kinase stk1 protein [Neofusicoccum parvum UCRNP2]|uniref:non-specific serine/threonine protein kinase n=1 Tax=Botryosphaeria parva (strain UCR-NP2) TaxID=1287680 RepID=R1G906_BOTPV|nr:putative serine-threonine kinase stk1 protein [Neofusicoccum parvum UCRNP2]
MALHNDHVGHLLGSGGTGDVYAAYIDGRPSQFDNPQLFAAELAAYTVIARVPALQRHLCPFYGVYDGADLLLDTPCHPRALRLALLQGAPLHEVLAERDDVQQALAETVRLLHDAGVCHGDIRPANIFVHGAGVRLLDFSKPVLRSAVSPLRWENATRVERASLRAVFADLDSREARTRPSCPAPPCVVAADPLQASRQVLALLNRARPDDPGYQLNLARHLARIAQPDPAVLRAVFDAAESVPSAELALALGRALARSSDVDALRVLYSAISHPAPPNNDDDDDDRTAAAVRLHLLTLAARVASRLEAAGARADMPPGATAYGLFNQAIALASRLRRPAHPHTMELRVSFVRHLYQLGVYQDVVVVAAGLVADAAAAPALGELRNVLADLERLLRTMNRGVQGDDGDEGV